MNGNGNRNGDATLTRRIHSVEEEPAVKELVQLPPWLVALRDAMGSSIAGDDLKLIMKAQIDKAKEGDIKAANFVMSQAHKMLQAEQKKVTIVQNNYYDGADPDATIDPDDDQRRQLKKLTGRARAHQPLTGRAGDARVRPVSDEEEKELRRQQQAAEENTDTGPEGD
jgi:hypothetical protein